MNKVFIYYSLSGNGDKVALELKKQGYEIRKVESKLKLSKHILLRMLKGGFLSLISYKPKLIGYDPIIDDFSDVVIGSPIWNGRLSSPANSILRETDLTNKKLTFILYSGSGNGKKAIKKINKKYPNAKTILLKEPNKYKNELDKINF